MTDAELYEALRKRGDILEERITSPDHTLVLTLTNGTIELQLTREVIKVFLR